MDPVQILIRYVTGTRIGRVKVIFTLPKVMDTRFGPQEPPDFWPKTPLAFIEWYAPTPSTPLTKNGTMYHIKKPQPLQGRPPGCVIPISNIRESCMLFPSFPQGSSPLDWTTNNVLDRCDSFLINNWLSKRSYQSIW